MERYRQKDCDHKMIVIGGMIGVGKTTVAKILASAFKSQAYFEDVNDNPILPLFYTATKEEIVKFRYPFLLQLYFLNSRFKTIKKANTNPFNILDRSIYEDWYFARVNNDLGRISDLEFDIYERLYDNMLEEIEGLPMKKPILMIYLHASFDTIIKHIYLRGRPYEKDESLVDYYRYLWEGYDKWVNNIYHESEVMFVNMDHFDVIHRKEDQIKLIHLVNEKLALL